MNPTYIIAPDGHGDPTVWMLADWLASPVAICIRYEVHPVVWRAAALLADSGDLGEALRHRVAGEVAA